jgi:hypothetical protein
MPSYDRALWALRTWLDSWPGVGHVAVGMLARDVLHDRHGTLTDERDRHRLGADAVVRGAARGVAARQGEVAKRASLAASS